MKKEILFASVFALSLYQAEAQFTVPSNITGVPIETKNDLKVNGNRYLYENWRKGHVLQEDNKYFNNMELKYDVISDRPIFINNNGIPMAFMYPIKEFQIIDPKSPDYVLIFRNGFPQIGDNTVKSYYLVLTEGKAILLKKSNKSIIETIPYGEASTQKTIVDSEQYFILNNGRMNKIKWGKEHIVNVLNDKKNELAFFIKENSLSVKSDNDLTKIVAYYNKL